MSIVGTGMLTRSLPFFPVMDPCEMYLRRFPLIFPRTMSRKRPRSRSMRLISTAPPEPRLGLLALHVPTREDRADEVQHVGRALLVVSVVADQAVLHDLDLLLGVLVHDVGHQA